MPVHPFDPPRGRVETLTVDSDALRGNLLGDPTERRVGVYLPEGYDDSDADYPLFVDLVGFTGSGLKHLGWQAFAENVPQRLDRLVASGSMGPVIAVFPAAPAYVMASATETLYGERKTFPSPAATARR